MKLKKTVVHLTSVHSRYDTRIFRKECISLSESGYDVSLIVADGKGDESKDGVSIYDIGSSKGRLERILNAPSRVLEKAKELNADIYHIHDPELLPLGLKLKKCQKLVIFDAHEDVEKQILGKPYLNFVTKIIVSKVYSIFERWACRKLDAVVSATPFIKEKFNYRKIKSVDINNYPLLTEFSTDSLEWSEKKRQVCYVGGLSPFRGIKQIVRAMSFVTPDISLVIGGKFNDVEFEQAVKSEPGWEKATHAGWLDRNEVRNVLSESVAGLVTLHPLENYKDALPVKMFEYMAIGIPVIASNFPLWKKIVEGNDCGLCVDPLDPKAISRCIIYLVNNPEHAKQMASNGREAVKEHFNWNIEKRKLVELYERLCED